MMPLPLLSLFRFKVPRRRGGLLAAALLSVAGMVPASWAQTPGADAAAAVDKRLAGKPVALTSVILWGWGDFVGGKVAWNKNLWAVDWNPYFTCFSPWNSNEELYQGGTLVTPRHLLFAEHFSGASGSNTLHAGDTIKFVGKTDILYDRKLKATPRRVGSSDLCLGTLDRDLPPDVIPAQLLPPGLPPNFLPPGTPVLITNKDKQLHVAEVASFGAQAIMPARNPARIPWTRPSPAVVGDSGSPVFVILHDRPVLWWLFHTPNSGESISANLSVIGKMLDPGYKLDVATVKGL